MYGMVSCIIVIYRSSKVSLLLVKMKSKIRLRDTQKHISKDFISLFPPFCYRNILVLYLSQTFVLMMYCLVKFISSCTQKIEAKHVQMLCNFTKCSITQETKYIQLNYYVYRNAIWDLQINQGTLAVKSANAVTTFKYQIYFPFLEKQK